MLSVPIRLLPGQDIRRALEAALAERGLTAGFVIAGIGSLSRTPLRMAGRPDPTELTGDQELLTLSGSVSPVGSHLHATVSNADGEVSGGHLLKCCSRCCLNGPSVVLMTLAPVTMN